ncbi:MAG: hypothetical protein LUD81_05115 [Clostridiales bacterium]|nr:hypothetical protein [Clostridiales bacterium]
MKWVRKISVILFAVSVVCLTAAVYYRVKNGDSQPPVITSENNIIEVSVSADEDEILTGMTAYDNKDGDVTDSLMIESLSNFIAESERELNVAAFDSNGNVGKSKYILKYTDYTPTKFSLSEPLRFASGITVQKIKQNLTAEDCLDGDVTNLIVQSNAENSELNVDVPGVYTMTFSVANSGGDVEKFDTGVEIYDSAEESAAPKLMLSQYMVYIPKGKSYDPRSYYLRAVVDNVSYMWNGTDFISDKNEVQYLEEEPKIENNVNVNVPGWYETTYTLEDSYGDVKTIRQLVRVEEG